MPSNRLLAWTCIITAAAGAVLSFVALTMGFQIEGTTEAVAEAERGQAIGVPAVIAVLTGVAGLLLQRRPSGLRVCAAVSVVALVVALVVYATG